MNGNIVLFRANGKVRETVTHDGLDSSPVISPGGRKIAFLRTPARQSRGIAIRTVMLATPNNHSGYNIATFSQHPAVSTVFGRRTIAWEPGPHAPGLAWYDGNTVQYRRATGDQRTVLHVRAASSAAGNSITFAADDSAIASPVAPPRSRTYPRTLRIAVHHFSASGQRIITVRFRRGVLSSNVPYRGSYPTGDGLSYISPSHMLEFGTIRKGEGYQLTGLFVAPDTGGVAHLALGTRNAIHGFPRYGAALDGATHFQYSPNREFFATDPNNGFSIGGGVSHRRFIGIPHALSWVLAEWTWLPDSSGLAYVTQCTVPASSPVRYRFTLGSVSLRGGKRAVMDSIESPNPETVDLSPVYRCVACGG